MNMVVQLTIKRIRVCVFVTEEKKCNESSAVFLSSCQLLMLLTLRMRLLHQPGTSGL